MRSRSDSRAFWASVRSRLRKGTPMRSPLYARVLAIQRGVFCHPVCPLRYRKRNRYGKRQTTPVRFLNSVDLHVTSLFFFSMSNLSKVSI